MRIQVRLPSSSPLVPRPALMIVYAVGALDSGVEFLRELGRPTWNGTSRAAGCRVRGWWQPKLIDLIWNRQINPGPVFDLEPPPTRRPPAIRQ
jgi:hypothetical protein